MRALIIAAAVVLSIATPSSIVFAQSQNASINGETIAYEISGQGEPLVLIHGWSLNANMWQPQMTALRQKFQVIKYDRRGFGKSSGGEDITWDAEDLKALLDRLNIRKAHVLGMSQGGRVALQFARRNPERVLSLMLHGSPPPDGFGVPFTGPDRPRFEEWTVLAKEQGLDAFRKSWAAHPLTEVPAGNADARRRVDALLAEYHGTRFLKPVQPSGPVPAITMDDLSRINVPTLVLIGDREVPYLQIVARALAYTIPNARLTIVPGGGHMINVIEPARYNAAVLDFLTTYNSSR
jgi:pimeloyl-ACP methyl ester carboxylesterase